MNHLQKIANLYRGQLLFNLFMLVVIIAVFPERFSLLEDPISWLGKTGSNAGLPFYNSFWLFSGALLFNIFRWSQILLLLNKLHLRGIFLVLVAGWAVLAGFILMLFPCDRFDAIHSTGGTLVNLGMWLLSTLMLISLGSSIKPPLKAGLHIFLHASALYCIINFAYDTPLKGFSQRPAILAIVAVTYICFRYKELIKRAI